MLTLTNLNVTVEQKPILKNLSFTFETGKIYAVMGPNGSGKSTLAYSLMGHPSYTLSSESRIALNGDEIQDLEPGERAEKGLFLSFQTPQALSGVRVYQLLQHALQGKKDALSIRNEVKAVAKQLRIPEDLLARSLNEGASGGERKKMEVLQAVVLEKNTLIFDEVDTGVDVDALKTISTYLQKHREGKTYIIITHYNRILQYLTPDTVLVIANGEIKKTGDASLAMQIEKHGYDSIISK